MSNIDLLLQEEFMLVSPGVIFVRDDLYVLQKPDESRNTPTQTSCIGFDKNNLIESRLIYKIHQYYKYIKLEIIFNSN